MKRALYFCLFFYGLHCSAGVFFHELSYIEIKPQIPILNKTFGFSLTYQNGARPNLFTGAPHSDVIGKVFKCPFNGILRNKTALCMDVGIDVNKLAPYSRDHLPDLKMNLGYSVAAAKDYLFTCAPLWTAVSPNYNAPFGTCFIYNETTGQTQNYNGELKLSLVSTGTFPLRLLGGNGWRTLLDPENDILIIAKVALNADISHVNASEPFAKTLSMMADSPDQTRHANKQRLSEYRNVGFSLAVGNFFDNRNIYAISAYNTNGAGTIHFIYMKLSKHELINKLYMLKTRREYVTIQDSKVGTMFGAAMSSSDLDNDGFTELLVGAPAQDDGEGFETGAVHIYLGGSMKNINDANMHRVLIGTEDGSRFGTSIASSDIDGDNLTELFISAPYENQREGALYIFSGLEIFNKLINTNDFRQITISQLEYTQKIRNKDFKTFGYSLQVIPDLDDNGCDELAIGSPGSENIMLLRCIPSVKVILDAKHKGNELVKEQDTQFIVEVCVDVKHLKRKPFSLKLIVSNEVIGNAAYIDKIQTMYEIIVVGSKDKINNKCKDIIVNMVGHDPGEYRFSSKVQMDETSIMNSKDFQASWAMINPSSVMEDNLQVSRHCSGKDCEPNLTMNVTWSGGLNDTFELGSADFITVLLHVRNEGNSSWESCALVSVSGAPVSQIGCITKNDVYKCVMPSPLRRFAEHEISIKLNISQPTNFDKEVAIHVDLNDFCNKVKNIITKDWRLRFTLNTETIQIKGVSNNRQISDKDLTYQKEPNINDAHEYLIINNGSVTWKNISTVVKLDQMVYTDPKSFQVSSTIGECHPKESLTYACSFDLLPRSTVKIIVSVGIIKSKTLDNLVDDALTISSSCNLHLTPTTEVKEKRLIKKITIQEDLSLAQNKNLIIFLAILGAVIALAITVFILYKMEFFKRKEKTKLDALKKDHIRRQSVKHSSDKDLILEDMDITVDDDSPFEIVECPVEANIMDSAHTETPNEERK